MNLSRNDRVDEQRRQQIQQALWETAGLLEYYDWPDDLLAIDPDHYMVTMALIGSEVEERLPEANLLSRTLMAAMDHFMDGETRCRFLDAIEAKLRDEQDAERQSQLQTVADFVENPEAPLHGLPFLVKLFGAKIQEAADERARLRSAEPSEHAEIASIIEQATQLQETDGEGIEATAERLAAFGFEGLPFVASALMEEGESAPNVDPLGRAKALTRALGRIGGDRSIEHLVRVLVGDADETLKDETCESLALAGERAAQILMDMLLLGLFQNVRRVRALEALLRLGRRDVAGYVMACFDESIWPEGEFTDALFERLVEIALSFEDKTVLPGLIRMLRRKSLAPERRNYLHNRLMKTPWRGEAQAALARLKEGLPVFVKSGEAEDLLNGKGGRPQRKKTRGHSQEEIVQALQEAYHEDLGWRRPVDIHSDSDGEGRVTERVENLFDRDFRTYCVAHGANPRDPQALEAFRDSWLIEPHKDFEGESPWAAMVKRDASARGGDAGKHLLQAEADSLYHCALEVYQSGEPERAKKRLNATLSIRPDHALARRLLRKVEEGGAG